VAIHQPNFFPWLGYFDKIARSDLFVFLDDVQYQKTGGTWSNRVKLLINSEGRWVTAPIDRSYHGTRTINEITFSEKEEWRWKILKTIQAAYRRAPHFSEVWEVIEPLVCNPVETLAEFNVHAITGLTAAIGLDTSRFVRSSCIPTGSVATQRLIELTRSVGGDSYLCGGGSSGYQEDLAFADAGLNLLYQGFSPVPYQQQGAKDFVPGLSIIDAAMNVGWSGVMGLLAAGKADLCTP
jgi:hypothetical protein